MTIKVTVETHNWPAQVTIKTTTEGTVGHNTETVEATVEPRQSMSFTATVGATISVQELPPVEATALNPTPFQGEPVPGAAENDALLKRTPGGKRAVAPEDDANV